MKHLKTYQIFEANLKPAATRAPYRQGKETFPSKDKAYHLTPDIHLDEIKRVGLKLKTENKLENHPDWATRTTAGLKFIKNDFTCTKNDNSSSVTIEDINTSDFTGTIGFTIGQ